MPPEYGISTVEGFTVANCNCHLQQCNLGLALYSESGHLVN